MKEPQEPPPPMVLSNSRLDARSCDVATDRSLGIQQSPQFSEYLRPLTVCCCRNCHGLGSLLHVGCGYPTNDFLFARRLDVGDLRYLVWYARFPRNLRFQFHWGFGFLVAKKKKGHASYDVSLSQKKQLNRFRGILRAELDRLGLPCITRLLFHPQR